MIRPGLYALLLVLLTLSSAAAADSPGNEADKEAHLDARGEASLAAGVESRQDSRSMGKVRVEYHFNPFCGPSQQSLHYVIGPLHNLLSNQAAVTFQVVPLRLGQEAYEGRAVAALLCQIEKRGAFPALAAVAAETRDSMERGDSESRSFSWDRYSMGDPCYNLASYQQKSDSLKTSLRSRGDIYTPALFIDGIEISPFDLKKVHDRLIDAIRARRPES